ncbi:MAG: hypothetical protein Q9226_004251 [Calogaya cf. arnoldii]
MEPKCSNQAFNVVNGDAESWQNLWPKMAKRFGCKVPANQFDLPVDRDAGSVMELAPEPPKAEAAAERGLQGKVAPGKVEQRMVEKDALEQATWGFLAFVLGRNYNIVQSMSKARRLGWTGYIDTWDSLSECFDELEMEKILSLNFLCRFRYSLFVSLPVGTSILRGFQSI